MKKILWLTNLPAPYRIPIWSQIGKSFDLRVVFLLGEINWRNWSLNGKFTFNYDFLNLRCLKIGELELIPGIKLKNLKIASYNCIVFGSWENPMYLFSMFFAKCFKIKTVCIYESTIMSNKHKGVFVSLIKKVFFNNADCIISFGPKSTESLVNLGISTQNVLELYNPVPPFLDYSREESDNGHRFLFVGQLIARKNIFEIIKGFQEIRNTGDTLTIVGDGDLRLEIDDYIHSRNLSKHVIMMGHLDSPELTKIYRRSDTLVLASRTEVWGLVVNEALSQGMHVVVTNNCGVAPFIQSMKGVFIVNNNGDSLSAGMGESRRTWKGGIVQPEIENFSTLQFADSFMAALNDL